MIRFFPNFSITFLGYRLENSTLYLKKKKQKKYRICRDVVTIAENWLNKERWHPMFIRNTQTHFVEIFIHCLCYSVGLFISIEKRIHICVKRTLTIGIHYVSAPVSGRKFTPTYILVEHFYIAELYSSHFLIQLSNDISISFYSPFHFVAVPKKKLYTHTHTTRRLRA